MALFFLQSTTKKQYLSFVFNWVDRLIIFWFDQRFSSINFSDSWDKKCVFCKKLFYFLFSFYSQIFGTSTDQLESPAIELTLEKWRHTQEGRELLNEVYPISVDQLFTLLFTNSKFYRDLHANRKTFGKQSKYLIGLSLSTGCWNWNVKNKNYWFHVKINENISN